MYCIIHNLYHIEDGSKAYYRKQGVYCFDFVTRREFASNLTTEEANNILTHADWYCNQFGASHMSVEEG